MSYKKTERQIEASRENVKKAHAAVRGKHLSEEHKRKIGLASTGRIKSVEERKKLSKALKGHPIWNTGRTRFKKGHKMSEETKEKIRQTVLKKGIKPPHPGTGKDHISYKHGLSGTQQYKKFYGRKINKILRGDDWIVL